MIRNSHTPANRSLAWPLPVVLYFLLAFAISWSLVLIAVVPGGFPGTPQSIAEGYGPAFLGMLVGPPLAAIAVSLLFSGPRGLRDVLASVLIWRIRPIYYLMALLLVPATALAVLLLFSLFSGRFIPEVFTARGGLSFALFGIALGLVAGGIEEIGWTGFAMRRLFDRHSVLAIGIGVGILHGVWHLVVDYWVSSSDYESLYPLYFLLAWVTGLTGLRLVIAFLVRRTGSTLIAQLAHASYSGSLLFMWPTAPSPVETIAWTGTFAITLVAIGLALTIGMKPAEPA